MVVLAALILETLFPKTLDTSISAPNPAIWLRLVLAVPNSIVSPILYKSPLEEIPTFSILPGVTEVTSIVCFRSSGIYAYLYSTSDVSIKLYGCVFLNHVVLSNL